MLTRPGTIERIPECPVCKKPVKYPSMHEAIITRGMAAGLSFDERMQIYVPENCVLLHETCHLEAQHTEAGLHKCVAQLLHFNGLDRLQAWLDYMNSVSRNMFIERQSIIA